MDGQETPVWTRVKVGKLALSLLVSQLGWGQVFTFTKDQMIAYTAQNPFERFPDGRPKVPDALLDAEETQHTRNGWIKKKFDEREYKSSEIYGRPRDPALAKELEEYIKKGRGNQ